MTPTGEGAEAPAPADAGASPTSEKVAAVISLLTPLRDLPLAAHPDVYQRIHAGLQGALADIDDA